MKKVAFMLLVTLLTGLFVTIFPSGLAESSTPVSGIITQDTTWTKTNSPYTLTGPVGILNGITLTIEPGVTLNLNKYYLVINGTLIAKGTISNKIQINGVDGSPPPIPMGSSLAISFTYGITGNGVGTFENTIVNSVRIAIAGTINNCTINGYVSVGKSSIISNSHITGLIFAGGNSQIFKNIINGGIQTEYDSPTISDNVISGDGGAGIWFYLSENVAILNNTITGCGYGIFAQGGSGTIKKNFIASSTDGIAVYYDGTVSIQENTLENNDVGVLLHNGAISTIINNNLANNHYNIYLSVSTNLNAANNFWGTTDTQAINQTIYDSKNDFNLGTVTFVPFLTIPNPEAPAILTPSPTPTPNASSSPLQTPSATPSQSGSNNEVFFGFDWAQIVMILMLGIIAVLLATMVTFLYKKKVKATPKT